MMQKKLKIMRIIARLNVGGPAIHAILLTEALNNEDFESILVTGRIEAGEKDMIYLAKQKGINPVIIPELGRRINPLKDFIAFYKIYKLLLVEEPDIVHTHTAKAGALGRIAAVLAGVPVRIHTFHGHIFENYFNKFSVALFLFIERILASFTKVIVVVSKAQKKDIGELYKIADARKINVIPLGLELEKLFSIKSYNGALRKELNADNDTILIGIIGRLVPIKNHKMFLEAARILSSRLGGRFKIKFVIIGDGEERLALEEYIKNLNIADVVFCGWREDMTQVYSDLDIIALTSFNEGTPVTLIEALASGKPVVATSVGGVIDVVEDGKNGYLVPSGDAQAFAQCLAELAESSQKRSDFGAKGRETVRARFSKQRLVEDLTELYEDAFFSANKLSCIGKRNEL